MPNLRPQVLTGSFTFWTVFVDIFWKQNYSLFPLAIFIFICPWITIDKIHFKTHPEGKQLKRNLI